MAGSHTVACNLQGHCKWLKANVESQNKDNFSMSFGAKIFFIGSGLHTAGTITQVK